jgi:hypothetical protein
MNGYIIGAIASACLGIGFYVGHLTGEVKTDDCKTAAEASTAAQARTVTDALLTDRSQEAAQAVLDNKAEATHEQDVTTIDTTVSRTDPVFVRSGPAAVCPSSVPDPKAKAGALTANPQGGGSQPVGGGGDNRRGEIEALKKKLELVTADYRRLDAEWPQPPKETP